MGDETNTLNGSVDVAAVTVQLRAFMATRDGAGDMRLPPERELSEMLGVSADSIRKVKESLDATLKIAPKHAEAHTALGLYHAEIVGKIGGMIASLTYGAKAASTDEHCKLAIKLTPESPIALIEYANALMLIHGDKKEDEAAALYAKAIKLKPHDAMEALDIAHAKAQME